MEQTIVVAGQPSRNRPTGQVILAVLLVAFPLLALLVLEQGRVIDAQRMLIRQLSGDSQELNAIRVRELQNRAKQAAPSAKPPQADTQQQPSTQQPPGPTPERNNRKRHESKQAPPAPPQEYPGTRQVPVRKSVKARFGQGPIPQCASQDLCGLAQRAELLDREFLEAPHKIGDAETAFPFAVILR